MNREEAEKLLPGATWLMNEILKELPAHAGLTADTWQVIAQERLDELERAVEGGE